MALLERLKNYNESGNAKILPYAVLKSTSQDSYKHLITTGWPNLKGLFSLQYSSKECTIMERIPWNIRNNTPALSATPSIKFSYGLAAERVSL